MKLRERHVEILLILHENSGLITRRVAERAKPFGNKRETSGAVRSWLNELRRAGYVEYFDDEKPVCWKRTVAGSEALREALLSGRHA